MDIKGFARKFTPEIDSPQKIYDLFRGLGYPSDKVLDPSYKRKVKEFDFSKEEQEKECVRIIMIQNMNKILVEKLNKEIIRICL